MSPSFDPSRDIPSLHDQIIIVTGGTSGLGLETIKVLARHPPAHIFLAARSRLKAESAIAEIQAATTDTNTTTTISFLELDLASFSSIKAAASAFLESFSHSSSLSATSPSPTTTSTIITTAPRLDILINNAGIMDVGPNLTHDGYEIQFGTNVMGPALFTQLLLPTLRDTFRRHNRQARVVSLSSATEGIAPPVAEIRGGEGGLGEELKGEMRHRHTTARYALSKLGVVLWTRGLHFEEEEEARRLGVGGEDGGGDGGEDDEGHVGFVAVHPGMVVTNLHRDARGFFLRMFLSLAVPFGTPVVKGVMSQIWAAVSTEAKSGEFYGPVGKIIGPSGNRGDDSRDAMWAWMKEELGVHVRF